MGSFFEQNKKDNVGNMRTMHMTQQFFEATVVALEATFTKKMNRFWYGLVQSVST